MAVSVNKPQHDFISLPNKFKAFVGGFGSGKTWAGSIGQAIHFLEYPKVNQGYFSPTYPQIRDIFFPTADEVAFEFGLKVNVREGNKEVHWYNGARSIGTTICRSMDKPQNIVGFKIGKALVDEIDIMPIDKATTAWRKIIARMRWPDVQNGVDVTTKPEGFNFVHNQFVQHPDGVDKSHYGIVHASTYDNELNLPDDYIDSLIETYPAELIEAYLNGQFVNLTSGSVYRNYDRARCNSTETIRDKETLYIGQDFNVGEMASCIFVKRETGWHCVAELSGLLDTPDVINVIQGKYPENKIYVYPDASGKARKTVGASTSDISLLKAAGFTIRAKNQNPLVKDRVLSVNTALSKSVIWVNAKACPETAKCLEQQAYDKNGEPDKKSGVDHQVDAFGYPIAYEMPINKPMVQGVKVAGLY
ncbi:MAG: terminase [Planctomycetes bacterium]|nr:terminase [Planctomycetota bacterium]